MRHPEPRRAYPPWVAGSGRPRCSGAGRPAGPGRERRVRRGRRAGERSGRAGGTKPGRGDRAAAASTAVGNRGFQGPRTAGAILPPAHGRSFSRPSSRTLPGSALCSHPGHGIAGRRRLPRAGAGRWCRGRAGAGRYRRRDAGVDQHAPQVLGQGPGLDAVPSGGSISVLVVAHQWAGRSSPVGLAELTGLDPRVISAWAARRGVWRRGAGPEAARNFNWLNIGYFDSGAGKIAFRQVVRRSGHRRRADRQLPEREVGRCELRHPRDPEHGRSGPPGADERDRRTAAGPAATTAAAPTYERRMTSSATCKYEGMTEQCRR